MIKDGSWRLLLLLWFTLLVGASLMHLVDPLLNRCVP